MSKSRSNAIPISATADQTARLIAGAKTDAERQITYDPARRPEVSNLVLLAALCLDRAPHDVADDIGDGGSAALKRLVTEAVNERFRDIRARRADLATDPGHLHDVLHNGNQQARQIAEQTLTDVRRLMHTDYDQPA